jgi:hypothetical protein
MVAADEPQLIAPRNPPTNPPALLRPREPDAGLRCQCGEGDEVVARSTSAFAGLKENVMFKLIWKFICWNWNIGPVARVNPALAGMPITHAVDKGGWVDVYSGNHKLFTKNGGLAGYTANSVSIKSILGEEFINTYDERGELIARSNANIWWR